jgi:hypothetical protein
MRPVRGETRSGPTLEVEVEEEAEKEAELKADQAVGFVRLHPRPRKIAIEAVRQQRLDDESDRPVERHDPPIASKRTVGSSAVRPRVVGTKEIGSKETGSKEIRQSAVRQRAPKKLHERTTPQANGDFLTTIAARNDPNKKDPNRNDTNRRRST